MASIDKRKLKRGVSYAVVFYLDGEKKKIYLGKEYKYRDAQEVRLAVEDFVASHKTGNPLPRSTTAFLENATDDMKSRLSCLGLEGAKSNTTLKDAWSAFIRDARVNVKETTILAYRSPYVRLRAFLDESTRIATITAEDANAFRTYLQNTFSQGTVKTSLTVMKMFFRWAVKKGLAETNVFDGVRGGTAINKERSHYISLEEAKKLLSFMPNKELRLLFACWRYAGMRKNEPFFLKPDAFDLNNRVVTIQSPKTAHVGKASRRAPILQELYDVLQEGFEYPFFDGLREEDPWFTFKRILAQNNYARYPRLIQNLRASFENDLVLRGFPSHVVAEWVGHTVSVQEQHYLQVSTEYFQRAIKSVG